MTMRDSQDAPRVLVLAADEISDDFSTGITVANLFRDWPAGRLAQLCLIPSSTGTRGLTPRTATLPGQGGLADIPVRWTLRQLRRLSPDGPPPLPGAVSSPSGQQGTGRRLRRVVPTHATLAALLEMGPTHVDRRTAAFVRQFRPDVVYSPMSGIRMMRLAQQLHDLTGAPVVPHLLDDWPTTLFSHGELGGRARATMLRLLERTLSNAPAVGVISEAMAVEYLSRYGVTSTPIMNCVNQLGSPKPKGTRSDVVRFAYVGGLHLGRAALLAQIASVVQEIPGAELHLHAPQEDLDRNRHLFSRFTAVRYGPERPAEAVADVLAEADALVHVESFDDATSRYTRLSISTKIPQYLAAARPVLALGPPGLASIQHLRSSGAAQVVDDPLSPNLSNAVARLTVDATLRHTLSVAGVGFAAEHHDGSVVRDRLQSLLEEAMQ